MTDTMTVPRWLVIEWDEDGEAQAFKRIELCTRDEVCAYIDHLYGQISALTEEIQSIVMLATGEYELIPDDDTAAATDEVQSSTTTAASAQHSPTE